MAHNHHNAHAAGLAAPELVRVDHVGLATLGTAGAAPAGLSPLRHKDECPELAGGGALKERRQDDNPDSRGVPHAGQALRVIEGETKAARYLDRLHAEQADPDELALIVSMLYGATLRGFCRVLVKALGARHG